MRSADCIRFLWGGVNLDRDCKAGDLIRVRRFCCRDPEPEVGTPWRVSGFVFDGDPNKKKKKRKR